MVKILLNEDYKVKLDVLSRRLVGKGYDVAAARNGEIGASLAPPEYPEIILMNMRFRSSMAS